MNLRLLAAGLAFPFLGSCALVQLPAKIIGTAVAPLRADNEHDEQLDLEQDPMATEAMIALKASPPASTPRRRD